MEIYYDNRTKENVTSIKKLIKKSLGEVIKEEQCFSDVEVSVSFVTDEEIKELNNNFRGKNKSTDVLSFPMIDYNKGMFFKDMLDYEIEESKDLTSGNINLGDIVVSLDTIKRQAVDFNNTFEKELCLMVIHSMLHLMGYDHMVKCEEKVMFKKQEDILSKVKF
ncbi:MAG: rRNA maturation RNase YbeY [Clostridia bacterium]|nr:rRNA maturation RNase YbeY [Clostridia bacterium]